MWSKAACLACLLGIVLVYTSGTARGQTGQASSASALQASILQARDSGALFHAAMRLLDTQPTEDPAVWVSAAADVNRPWAIRCFAMRALMERFIKRGEDLGEAARRLGIGSWFAPGRVVQKTVPGDPFDDSRLATDTIFMVHIPNEPEDVEYYVYVRVGGKEIFAGDVSSAASGKEPRLTITGVLPLQHELKDMRVRKDVR